MNDLFEKEPSPERDKDRRAVRMVRRFMERSRDYRAPYLRLAQEARELYEVWEKLEQRTAINRAALPAPYAYQIIQEQLAALAAPFLQERTPFVLRGEVQEAMQWENAVTDHMGLQLEQAKWGPKFLAFLENLQVEGTAIQMVPYRYEEKVLRVRAMEVDPFTGEAYPTKKEKVVVCRDGPDLENIALVDFFPDWTVTTPGEIQAMRGCAYRVYKNLKEIREKEQITKPNGEKIGIYKNLDELQVSLRSKGCDAWRKPYYEDSGVRDDKEALKKPVELWVYWGLFDVSGDGDFEEYVIVIANGDVVIRCEPNFYDYKIKPFVATPNIVRGQHWYGLSELFAVRGPILEAVRLRNARLDAVNLAVNPMWKLERSAGANPHALYARPNGIVLLNNNRGLEPLPPPQLPHYVFTEVQELGSEMQQAAGALSGPSLTAAGRVFGRSATGAQLASAPISNRLNLKMLTLSMLYFKPLAELCLQTNAQFVTDNQLVKNYDPEAAQAYVEVPAEAFHLNYAYEPLPAVLLSQEQEQQKMQAGLPFLQAADQAQPGVINWEAFFADAGRGMFGRRVKKFTRSAEEVQAMQAQGLAMRNALNAQQGAAAPQPNAQEPRPPLPPTY